MRIGITARPPRSAGDLNRPPIAAGSALDGAGGGEEGLLLVGRGVPDSARDGDQCLRTLGRGDTRDDPDVDQIRAATLLSLGTHRSSSRGEEAGAAAEALSRRYWDYNVVDYDEKILDGFYDIYGLSINSASHGKMPSLVDLQSSIGDLGYEVIIVNRAIDLALVELEQVAHCISLDFREAEVGFLVQRISELIAQHMGGPVKDAPDMFATWMEKSTELRTSQQTSLLPIGCINIGLSRHRSLLFKILADDVGIPCKLVKGSHYTGIEDDAVNIIKFGDGREFLVDLMAAPGTLLPADVLNAKDATTKSYNETMNQSLLPWIANSSADDLLKTEPLLLMNNGSGNSTGGDKRALDQMPRYENTLLVPKVPNSHSQASSTGIGSSSSANIRNLYPPDKSNQFSPTNIATTSKQKEAFEVRLGGDTSQDTADSRNLFSELNPFQAVGVPKPSVQLKAADGKNIEYDRRREKFAGRQPPLVWKNRTPCNLIPNANSNNCLEGLPPRQNIVAEGSNASTSHSSGLVGRECSNAQNVRFSAMSPYSAEVGSSDKERNDLSSGTTSGPSEASNFGVASGANHDGGQDSKYNYNNVPPNRQIIPIQSSGDSYVDKNYRNGWDSQNRMMDEIKEHGKNVNHKHDRKKYTADRFMGTSMLPQNPSWEPRPSRLDPMLDDVAEWEIPWEHLVIGERIGLGSYGEVYQADWNGTEVAVKKFLDQDFYGDALDEFRSEVRIMRRLRHPNVVLFLGAVTRPPNLSIVSEFLPRGSLYRILHRPHSQIDEKRRIKMALDVAKGMNCLHTSTPTIVHRDLKSPNLLVDKNWTVKVCDFGLSRLKHSTFLSSKSTAGTPEWMAPEVLRNEQSNEKCDVYSFGVILWELATLRKPWHGMNPMQVVGAVGFQDRRLDIPKEVDPLVARIILECWQTEPSLRPSFAQLMTALKSLQRLMIPPHQESQSTPLPQEIHVNSTP
ncbi:uncharacterized protein A4U43_C08F18990 [Asparagus officinalis]|nr:uncharacterized protein A4U43_C08F18990 [Asparagus officinalis]